MEIKNLNINNLKNLSTKIEIDTSIAFQGLSGSGKTTFCRALATESIKRILMLLPKSEYKFLYSGNLKNNISSQNINEIPLILFLEKASTTSNPRSTIGTHTNIFKTIRKKFAKENNLSAELFSFNHSIFWCKTCKGRGSIGNKVCPECNGKRYSKDIEKYSIKIKNKFHTISEINDLDIHKLLELVDILELNDKDKNILENMIKFEIGYLTLNRTINSLSGGEVVRLFLSEFLTYSENIILIIDEVSIGLDIESLDNILEKISLLCKNNQIFLIDHSKKVINSTEKIISFGPESGNKGGKIIEKFIPPLPIYYPCNYTLNDEIYKFLNLKKRVIDIKELIIPKNRLIVVTGKSGCGKSTLINECIKENFEINYPKNTLIIISQDKNKSITSKSTIETFLELKNEKNQEYVNNISICEALEHFSWKNSLNLQKLELLRELGLGYLTLDRKINTLSTGEFQCIHLISEFFINIKNECLFIFDEPSKGLSQNILNNFIKIIKKLLKNINVTILMIEHNEYIIKNSDFIIDFGNIRKDKVYSLACVPTNTFQFQSSIKNIKIKSNLSLKNGIKYIYENVDDFFNNYLNIFRGGILKNISSVARWIYEDYEYQKIKPVFLLDLEEKLYSKNTFLYELGGIINFIINKSLVENKDIFDYYNSENLCPYCKGTGKVITFDYINTVINDLSKDIWNGLFLNEVMNALKNYNFSKIKFLIKEVFKETNLDLNKPFNLMNEEERKIFLYGYWKKKFYDPKSKTNRNWQGVIFLIQKYMKSSKSEIKEKINVSKKEIVCPICNGDLLVHNKKLEINNLDIRNILKKRISELDFLQLSCIDKLKKITGENIKLNQAVSELPQKIQVQLKLYELEISRLYGFEILIKNTLPFKNLIINNINNISKNNLIYICDYPNIDQTKEELLEKYCTKGKIKRNTYLYELLGYKKIITKINKIKKECPCKYCNGKKVLREESIFEGIDIFETSCNFCNQTGLSEEGLNQIIDGISVKDWTQKTIKDIINLNYLNEELNSLNPLIKVENLNKKQIMNLLSCFKNIK